MSTTVSYKGNIIATVENNTKTLNTQGKYLEADVILTDVSQGTPSLQSKTKTYTPTESAQSETVTADSGYDGLSQVSVSVGAVSSTYVGTGITRRSSSDLTASGATLTVPSGYYSAQASKSVSTGSEGTPTATKGTVSNHSVSVTPSVTNTTGYITGSTKTGTAVTVSASELVSGTYTVTSAGTKDVTNYASASIASGTEGTPSATKGTVSNHSVSVTPSVTNVAGWISGGTKTGTAVTVSASELVSGSQTISQNGTVDVTNLASVTVDVQGGGSGVQIDSAYATRTSNTSISFTGLRGEPTSFVLFVDGSSVSPSATALVDAIVFDGTSLHGQTITNTSNAQVTYNSSSFSKSYSNGTLTISSTGPNFIDEGYYLDYSYGGSASNIDTKDVQVGSGATSITFTGLEDEPLYWSILFKSNFGTSSGYQRVIWVRKKQTLIYGHAMDSMTRESTSYWTSTYDNGSLTITSSGTNAGGYFHQPGYYQLTAVYGEASPYQTKTGIGATTTSQTITADSGYDALESVQINPITQTNLVAGNIKSGTTISISNGLTNIWSVTGTYTGGGGSSTCKTTTITNSNDQATSIQFTELSGEPKWFFVRLTSQLTRSSSYSYYYITAVSYNGTTHTGNYYRRSNGTFYNDTTHYSHTYNNGTLTVSSSASRGAAGGSFYNGTYELVYIY